jgi:actin-related protein 9
MPAFLALMNHIHSILSPTLHTPILLIAQPAWTAQDIEALTQFFFEKFKTPAFCIMDSALAISYAYGVQNATIIDIGFQKADITAVLDYSVQHVGRTIGLKNAGGDAMTERLLELLGPTGWTKDMCEQLKKSPLCEILHPGVPLPGSAASKEDAVSNPAAAASTGAASSGPTVKITEAPRDIEVEGEEDIDTEKVVDDEGVLDVASIIASGKTQEFLAHQERKKQMAAARKAAKDAREAADAAAAKPIRLPNSKREKVIFHYQERKAPGYIDEVQENGKPAAEPETAEETKEKTPETSAPAPPNGVAAPAEAPAPAAETNGEPKPAGEAPTVTDTEATVPVEDLTAKREQARAAKREEKRKAREGPSDPSLHRREIEVGTERFLAASNGLLERIADAVHRTVLAGTEPSRRSDLWDSLIIVGNGSRVRGFKDALLTTLSARYLISPSSATIFTSELPSNLSTPVGTGAQTPQREFPMGQHPLPTGSGVNPLLLAATTASHPALNPNLNLASAFGGGSGHSGHGQTPTSIKTAKVPEYFPEFKVCHSMH